MSDDPRVTVPAELVDALREASTSYTWDYTAGDARLDVGAILDAIRALVDAAERPANPDPICTRCGHGHMPEDSCRTPAAPVSEPRKPWVAPRGGGYSAPNTQSHPPRPGQSLSGEPIPPKGPGAVSTGVAPVPVSDHADCDHDCAVIVSDEDYQRSEGVCAGCSVRMKNDAKTGWGPSLPFGDVPCGSRVGECCPPHKFTNEGAPDVCDTCGDSEHPPVSDEAEAEEAWKAWDNASTTYYDDPSAWAYDAFLAGFNAGAAHMAGRQADAWDAGASALDEFHHHRRKVPGPMPPPNPFRLTPDTEGETDE